MWKLTIYQKKHWSNGLEMDEEISFVSYNMNSLLGIVDCMSKVEPTNEIRFEIKKEKLQEETQESRFINPEEGF